VAFVRHLAFPSGIAPTRLGQQWRWEGQELEQQRIPGFVSHGQTDIKWFTNQSWVANELACQPQERLLEVVVGLGGDVVVLKVLLSMESNGLGLYLSLLDINFVSGEDDRNILADTDQITWRELANADFRSRGITHGASWGRSCM
jgi:hypothetical protein